jgi:hypothetical protein
MKCVRVVRMRTILRFTKDARIEAGLRELIADAETRLTALEGKCERSAWDSNVSFKTGFMTAVEFHSWNLTQPPERSCRRLGPYMGYRGPRRPRTYK